MGAAHLSRLRWVQQQQQQQQLHSETRWPRQQQLQPRRLQPEHLARIAKGGKQCITIVVCKRRKLPLKKAIKQAPLH